MRRPSSMIYYKDSMNPALYFPTELLIYKAGEYNPGSEMFVSYLQLNILLPGNAKNDTDAAQHIDLYQGQAGPLRFLC